MDPKWLVDKALPYIMPKVLKTLVGLGIALTAVQEEVLGQVIAAILTALILWISEKVTTYYKNREKAKAVEKAVDVRTQALVGELPPEKLQKVEVVEKMIADPKVIDNPPPVFRLR